MLRAEKYLSAATNLMGFELTVGYCNRSKSFTATVAVCQRLNARTIPLALSFPGLLEVLSCRK